MRKLNQHISEYISFYLNLGEDADYAVLLKGDWGCGKTWFIKKEIIRLENEGVKTLYISLNGIGSFDEIENEMFCQLHPFLSNKKVVFAAKLIKSSIKMGLKLDFDKNGKDDASISLSPPDIDIPNNGVDGNGLLIVFDDLERCEIELSRILGYVNYFVEHKKVKVLVVSNEKEVNEKDDNYKKVKEKLIGRTFYIETDFKGFLDNFVLNIKNENYKSFIKDSLSLINELHESSGYNNLRLVKQVLTEFEVLYDLAINGKENNSELPSNILILYYIYSIELRAGKINISDIENILVASMYIDISDDEKSDMKNLQEVVRKYDRHILSETILDYDTWQEILDKSIYDESKIKKQLSSNYYSNNEVDEWKKLWHYSKLSDNEFDTALKIVLSKLESCECCNQYELLHVFGLLLFFSKNKLCDKSTSELVKFAQENIKKLNRDDRFLSIDNFRGSEQVDRFRYDSYEGLGYFSKDSDEFGEVVCYLNEEVKQNISKKISREAKKLYKIIERSAVDFYKVLVRGDDRESFHSVPILSSLDVCELVDKIVSVKPEERDYIRYTFIDRYSDQYYLRYLSTERNWLIRLKCELEIRLEKMDNTLSKYFYEKELLKAIENSISKFDS